MSERARTIIRYLFWGLVSYLASGISNLMGLGSDQLLVRILGDATVRQTIATMLNLDQEVLRWIFVVLGYCFFGLGTFAFIGIPLSKAISQQRKLKVELQNLHLKVAATDKKQDSVSVEFREVKADVKRRETSIRKIHEMTRKMLSEIRRRKMGD